MLGQRWPASETPLQWRFAGGADDGPFIAVFGYSIPSTIFFLKKKRYPIWTPLTKLSGSAHAIDPPAKRHSAKNKNSVDHKNYQN